MERRSVLSVRKVWCTSRGQKVVYSPGNMTASPRQLDARKRPLLLRGQSQPRNKPRQQRLLPSYAEITKLYVPWPEGFAEMSRRAVNMIAALVCLFAGAVRVMLPVYRWCVLGHKGECRYVEYGCEGGHFLTGNECAGGDKRLCCVRDTLTDTVHKTTPSKLSTVKTPTTETDDAVTSSTETDLDDTMTSTETET
ncbi:uncharacterized protein LOC106171128 [Lingula anatina]|uniref:Uncharacterized protein LOC106171128 n=1 Tax=Lingula anatina TaxID=7574 RepID=A0A1S3J942_LINAN|nr:uncharacterized protein LOC106171128 [Lingula anatina]|eukprot:XP_013406741.1 uncharacterized protein LOC106171128 [Lingula anatina]